jgi:hypothetical protein
MRRSRTFTVVAAYAGFHSLMALSVYWHAESGIWSRGQVVGPAGSAVPEHLARMGRELWLAGMLPQALLLPLIAAGFTCGAITLERERDLLEHLLLTRLSAAQIAMGKLLAGTGMCLLLLISTVPALSLCFLLGGVGPYEVAMTLLLAVAGVISGGALGLVISALARRTSVAAAVTLGLVAGLGLGLPLLAWAADAHRTLSHTEGVLGAVLLVLAGLALPPAVGAGSLLDRPPLLSPLPPGGPQRARRMALVGLCWAALVGLLHLPGASQVLLLGGAAAGLHPGMAILEVMLGSASVYPSAVSLRVADTGFPPAVCAGANILAGCWLTYFAVLRLRSVRR